MSRLSNIQDERPCSGTIVAKCVGSNFGVTVGAFNSRQTIRRQSRPCFHAHRRPADLPVTSAVLAGKNVRGIAVVSNGRKIRLMSNILSANELEPLLTPKDAAHLLGLSTSWLAKCRLRGDGPRYRKVGRAVRYARSDLREYLKARARTSTSER